MKILAQMDFCSLLVAKGRIERNCHIEMLVNSDVL